MTFASIWNNITETTSSATSTTLEYLDKKVGPAVLEATETVLKSVDTGCMSVNKATVEFLTKYPGIAMTLSPSSVIKVAVANHVDDLMQRRHDESKRQIRIINMNSN